MDFDITMAFLAGLTIGFVCGALFIGYLWSGDID